MKKMSKKNMKLLAGGLAVVGVGVLYWRGAFDKLIAKYKGNDAKEDVAEVEETPKTIPPTTTTVQKVVVAKPVVNTVYINKVKVIQNWLGVGATGESSAQTNLSLKKKLPTLYASLGPLSLSNVDKYTTAKDDFGKVSRGMQVWNAMTSGKPAKIVKTAKYPALFYDSSAKLWKPTGGLFYVKTNTPIYKSKSQLATDGYIVALNVTAYSIDANQKETPVGVKNLKINTSNLYV
jgi:hypothetical protein